MTEQQLSHRDAVTGSAEPEDLWRNEVSDRLARYKRRRGRRIEGAFTMRFPFPTEDELETTPNPAAVASMSLAEAVPSETSSSVALAKVSTSGVTDSDPSQQIGIAPSVTDEIQSVELVLEAPSMAEEEPAIFVDTVPRPRPKRKVIAFPKHLSVATEPMYRLADPVSGEAPRILDVPEELEAIPATPFLAGLGLDASAVTTAAQPGRDHVELPCRPVQISQRLTAAAIDGAIVLTGVAAVAAVAYRILEYPQLSKSLWLGLAAAAIVLWSAYQYLFVVHAGRTLGMMAARLRLRTFKGDFPNRKQRRSRVLALYFSTVSLGMGLMWIFADVDGFCWHDRLSRTFLASAE